MNRLLTVITGLVGVCAMCVDGNAVAGDAVGWMRVSVQSNDVAGALLPFSPLSGSSIGSFLAGPFVGDGGEDSDRLVLVSTSTGETNTIVYSTEGWLDPATGEASAASASPGDVMVLNPSGVQPFDFYVLE